MKTQNNNQTYKGIGLKDIQTGCLGGPAWGSDPNSSQQLCYVGIQDKLLFGLILFLRELCKTKIE